MKKLKMIYGWILISVILQTAVLVYLNYIYLPNRGNFKATMYEMDVKSVKDRSVWLPEGAADIRVSFDGLYAAYRLGEGLEIVDVDSKKIIKRLDACDGEFTYFRWLPDREMLIYSIKEPEGRTGRVRISTYDILPGLDRSYPDIKSLPEGSGVIDIQLSPLTNIVYSMIQTSKTRARIYKFDIMDSLDLIFKTDLTTKIEETMYTDNLIYQIAGERISIRNGSSGKTSSVPVKGYRLLLAVDEKDFIYVAETNDSGKFAKIQFGKAGQKAEEWESITLPRPLSQEDIIITATGSIYAVDRQNNQIKCIKVQGQTEELQIEYKGELLTALDHYVVSTEGNKLTIKAMGY